MTTIKQPIGFKQKRKIFGESMKSWIKEDADSRESVYGVFKGGGPKGAAFAGAVEVFEKQVKWKAVAGTSAGAITAAVLAAGYDGETYGRIFKGVDFPSLLDHHDIEEIKQEAYPWTLRADVDFLTKVIMKIDPDLLRPSHAGDLERRLEEKVEQNRWNNMGWSEWISSGAQYYITTPLRNSVVDACVSGIGMIAPEYIHDAIVACTDEDPERRKKAIVDFLSAFIGDQLPAPIQNRMMTNGKLDYDKAIGVLLGIYYKAGAFKGMIFLKTMEEYLQKALRPDETIDTNRLVTFRELPIPCRLIAADLSRQRIVSFPEGLADYGYDGKDGRKHYLDFSVSLAVRASMSLPLIFEPVCLPVESSKQPDGSYTDFSILVDGGIVNNFPLMQFADSQDNTPICGFWLGPEPNSVPALSTDRVSGYFGALIDTLTSANDRYVMDNAPDHFLLVDIDLKIPTTSEEQTALEMQRQVRRKEIDDQITRLDKEQQQCRKDQQAVRDDSELYTFVKKKEEFFQQLKKQLEQSKTQTETINSEFRDCETLDFTLNNEQKEALVENGRQGARKAIECWKRF